MADGVLVLRWVLAVLLGVPALGISAYNGSVFWRGWVRREHAPSWIPLLGGGLGALALLAAPLPGSASFWWLPLLLDWGSAPGIGHALLFHGLRGLRSRRDPAPAERRHDPKHPEATWREMPAFAGVDLEDSFVVGWHQGADALVIELEASLAPGHPSYEPPLPGNHACYKPARLVFPAPRSVEWLRPAERAQPSRDPDGSVDYGTLDTLRRTGERYRLIGEFADVSLESEAPVLEITSERQLGRAPLPEP